MQTLILGKGFIGGYLQQELKCKITGEFLHSYQEIYNLVKQYKPKVIINCIGITGLQNVDDCETEIDATLLANSFLPLMLAEVCLRQNIKLVHISSGCIFNGKNKPIKETQSPDFFRLFYSRSKIYSDLALEKLSSKFNILEVRIRIPLTNEQHPKNLLDKLIKFKKVISNKNSVTYLPDFVKAIKHLIKIDVRGVYNVVNKGGLSYPDLLKEYQKYVPNHKFKVVNIKNLALVRTNLILSTHKLEQTGFKVRDINSVIKECVREYIGRKG